MVDNPVLCNLVKKFLGVDTLPELPELIEMVRIKIIHEE